MNIACEKCSTAYVVDENRIPPGGLSMKCTVCSHVFTVLSTKATLMFGSNADALDFGVEASLDGDADLPAPVPPGGGGVTDLPGLPQDKRPPEVLDLPGLKPPASAPGPARAGRAIVPPPPPSGVGQAPRPPASYGQGAPPLAVPPPRPSVTGSPALPPLLSDLPENADLPAPKIRQAAPPAAAPLDFADFDLSAAPAEFDPMAADASTDLPTPVSAQAPGLVTPVRPGSAMHRQMGGPPRDIVDLPAPAGVIDLPTPAHVTDLPAPSDRIDLPQPIAASAEMGFGDVGLPDLEEPALELDAPAFSGSGFAAIGAAPPPVVDGLPRMASPDGDLPGGPAQSGIVDLPPSLLSSPPAAEVQRSPSSHVYASAGTQGSGTHSARAAVAFSDPQVIVDVPRGPAAVELAPLSATGLPSVAARETKTSPVERVISLLREPRYRIAAIGGAAVLLLLIVGLGLGATSGGIFGVNWIAGGSGQSSTLAAQVEATRKLMRSDTGAALSKAADDLQAANLAPDAVVARSLWAQALASLIIKFGPNDQRLRQVDDVLGALATVEEPPVELLEARALATLAHGDAAKAVDNLKQLATQHPGNAQVAVYLGWAQLQAKHLDDAGKAFQGALTLNAEIPAALYGQARVEAAAHRNATALGLVTKALGLSPQHAGALLLKASLVAASGDTDTARTEYQHVLTLTPPAWPTEQAEAHAALATLDEGSEAIDDARQHYEAAVKLDPLNARAQLGFGKLLLRAGQSQAATEHFRRALAADPQNVEAAIVLAQAELALGRPLDARTSLLAVAKRVPPNARIRYVLGKIEESVNALEAAGSLYQEAIKLDPKYLEPYVALSKVQLRRKELSQALATLQQANTAIPGAAVRNAMGEIYYAVGDLDQARKHFEEALTLDPKSAKASFNLANTLRDQGHLDEALARYEALKKRDQRYPGLAAALGTLHLKAEHYAEAADAYSIALEVDNAPAELRLDAVRAYLGVGRYDDALAQTEQVLRDQPTDSAARAWRAQALLGKGELQEANAEIGQVLDRDTSPAPDFYVIRAGVQEALGRLPDAVDSYSQALKLAPNRLPWRLERARLLVRSGTVKDGLKELDAVLKVDPKSAQAWLYKGIAYSDLGEEAKSTAAFNQALALEPTLGEAHLRIAQRLNDQHRSAAAWPHLIAAAEHSKDGDPWRAEAFFLLGQAAMQRKDKERAINAFESFLAAAGAKDAGRETAQKALAQLGVDKKMP